MLRRHLLQVVQLIHRASRNALRVSKTWELRHHLRNLAVMVHLHFRLLSHREENLR